MGKKKSDDTGTSKASGKDAKKDKISVSVMLASMDQKPDKPQKPAPSNKPHKPNKASAYTQGIDLPPSDDEDDEYVSGGEEQQLAVSKRKYARHEAKLLNTGLSDKELKKREKKEILAVQAVEHAGQTRGT